MGAIKLKLRISLGQLARVIVFTLLAVQLTRLVWAVFTPLGPVGNWQRADPAGKAMALAAQTNGFDPFFRRNGTTTGTATLTALTLKLYGVRLNEGGGGGSAIIATPDGVQSSYSVGQEIMPGVKLASVALDSVKISNGGAEEALFLDQSVQPGSVPSPASAIAAPPSGQGEIRPASFASDINLAPRENGGLATGLVLTPKGGGDAFRAAGLLPGDVLVSINGKAVRSVADSATAITDSSGAGSYSLQIERGEQLVTLNLKAVK